MKHKAPKLLTKKEIKKMIETFSEWKIDSNNSKFTRTFVFKKQIDALIFIARTTVNSEVLKHYPDITFTFLKVKMNITTHEVKGLTKDDVLLIARIEHMYASQEGDKQ